MQRFFLYFYAAIFFLTPLILWPYTSEVFEFNKIVFIYLMTTVVTTFWLVRCVKEERFIFRRTILDKPLILFLAVNIISTLLSIDVRTSIFGYYSRFNGGLLSILSYSLLYWAFVSNMDNKSTKITIYSLLSSAVLVSLYGIFQHFGIDRDIWVQDVQNRVFSTLGQPNWLAAFLLALTPITFTKLVKKPYSYILSAIFFITILFTKSRSGLIGFVAMELIFWSYMLFQNRKRYFKDFLIFNAAFMILSLAIGNPLKLSATQSVSPSNSPALETGGTESGTIRRIVWKGAFEIWKNYPLLGTGPETFAYAYNQFKPVEHNLVSEWDYIYNKAHNEYLNLAANTGTLGLMSYLILIGSAILLFIKKGRIEYLSGYVGLLISNFFGFSVVPTQLILFLFPAIVLTLNDK
jgi:O-antigen ligase